MSLLTAATARWLLAGQSGRILCMALKARGGARHSGPMLPCYAATCISSYKRSSYQS